MREFPMTGDQQSVITKDNVALRVSATIFCQVIDVKSPSSRSTTSNSPSTSCRAPHCGRSSAR